MTKACMQKATKERMVFIYYQIKDARLTEEGKTYFDWVYFYPFSYSNSVDRDACIHEREIINKTPYLDVYNILKYMF